MSLKSNSRRCQNKLKYMIELSEEVNDVYVNVN